ncbi:MAG: YraN family protein [Elusimicrobiaceae bacterium]|nr:YraN family protein [Elusimicrobiaceae bacterium]
MFSFLRRQGNIAEDQAAQYLKEKGYKILARNFAGKTGEIDIIAQDKQNTIIFVEVKQRKTNLFGGGLAAVNKAKQRRITLTAASYIKKTKISYTALRFDIITITAGVLQHYENAFSVTDLTI